MLGRLTHDHATNAALAAAPTLGLPVLAWTIPNTATRGLN